MGKGKLLHLFAEQMHTGGKIQNTLYTPVSGIQEARLEAGAKECERTGKELSGSVGFSDSRKGKMLIFIKGYAGTRKPRSMCGQGWVNRKTGTWGFIPGVSEVKLGK